MMRENATKDFKWHDHGPDYQHKKRKYKKRDESVAWSVAVMATEVTEAANATKASEAMIEDLRAALVAK